MNQLLPLLAVALCCAAPAAAQTDYHFNIDEFTSVVAWDLDLNVGDIVEQPATFAFDGTLILETGAATAPFGSATLQEGLLRTVPSVVGGQVPNPVPFLPPLGQFIVQDLQATISATNFAVAGDGSFTATAHMVTSAGVLTSSGSLGNVTTPLRGMFQSTQQITGTLTQVGSSLVLHVDLDVTLTSITPGGGLTGSLTLQGPIDAYTTTAAADPMTLLTDQPFTVGAGTTITVEHATPNEKVWLAYSTQGLGSFTVPQLGVMLALQNPAEALSFTTADGSGNASWSIGSVPATVANKSLWLQAAQLGRVSNVSNTWVQ